MLGQSTATPTNPGHWVLGIGASHNGGACLLRDGEIVVAVQEERLIRRKRARVWAGLESMSVRYCLEAAGIGPEDLAVVGVATQQAADSRWNDVHLNPALRVGHHRTPTVHVPHHRAHATGALATSGFDDAAVLVVDGLGSPAEDLPEEELAAVVGGREGWETASIYDASGASFTPIEKHLAPEGRWLWVEGVGMPRFGSLGGLFSAVATQIFGDLMEAGKVMGLAPYGEVTHPVEDFFTIEGGQLRFSSKVPELFRHSDRWPAREREYRDLAASVQAALEDGLLYLARRAQMLTGASRLCYAGGVALNSVANERIVRETDFEEIHFMPASEDSGIAVGAAYAALWSLSGRTDGPRVATDSLGASYSPEEVDAAVGRSAGIEELRSDEVLDAVAGMLADGHIVGWFHGGAELGPRALGHRSILCDPRRPDAKEVLNARVKHREAFRPFAPLVLREHAGSWFELGGASDESPFMLRVWPFRPERALQVPAVVHVDGTGRVQTLERDANPRLHELLTRFHAKTGVPLLLNTSLNVAGEPIVETPDEALWCLVATGLDACVIETRVFTKAEQLRSPLDLTPRLLVVRAALERVAAGASPAGDLDPQTVLAAQPSHEYMYQVEMADRPPPAEHVKLWTGGPHGVVVHAVAPAVFDLLALVDGKRDGWALLDAIGEQLPALALDKAELVSLLSTLRRARIIGFDTDDSEPRSTPAGSLTGFFGAYNADVVIQ
jgi:carbamoyltransferase